MGKSSEKTLEINEFDFSTFKHREFLVWVVMVFKHNNVMHVLIKSKWINAVKVLTFLSFINSFNKFVEH